VALRQQIDRQKQGQAEGAGVQHPEENLVLNRRVRQEGSGQCGDHAAQQHERKAPRGRQTGDGEPIHGGKSHD
jgi:hypothetical protein